MHRPTLALCALCALAAFAAAVLATPPSADLAALASEYERCGFDHVAIDANGAVRIEATRFSGDVGMTAHGGGVLRPEGAWFIYAPRSRPRPDGLPVPAELGAPRRLLPVVSHGRRYLLDDAALLQLVNQANLRPGPTQDGECLLHERLAGDDQRADRIRIDPVDALPPEYRSHLLPAPLEGRVAGVVAVTDPPPSVEPSAFPVGPPMPGEPPPPPLRQVRLEIDRGSAEGVFPGMRLVVGSDRPAGFTAVTVQAHRAVLESVTPRVPAPGDRVSSVERP